MVNLTTDWIRMDGRDDLEFVVTAPTGPRADAYVDQVFPRTGNKRQRAHLKALPMDIVMAAIALVEAMPDEATPLGDLTFSYRNFDVKLVALAKLVKGNK